jgi:hypothetical protein
MVVVVNEPATGTYSPETTIVRAHSYDYEIYRETNVMPKGYYLGNLPETAYAVYLDGAELLHPDNLQLGIDPPYSAAHFFPQLNRFFSLLEKSRNLQVVVAGHPRADYSTVGDMFEGRAIISGMTAPLVKYSELVITVGSTSSGMAALWRKAIIALTSDEIINAAYYAGPTRSMATALNLQAINLSASESSWSIGIDESTSKFDCEAYDSYVAKYIKSPGSDDAPLWSLISRNIQPIPPKPRLSEDGI